MRKNGDIREMSLKERGTILKKRVAFYEFLITIFQVSIIVFCFLAYKKIIAVHVEGAELLALNRALGYIMSVFAFSIGTLCFSLIKFVMLRAPWFKELWEDSWQDGRTEEKASSNIISNADKNE